MKQPTRIIFTTHLPLLPAGLREALPIGGFATEPCLPEARQAFSPVRGEDACLILVDSRCLPERGVLTRAAEASPQSRFVLYGSAITAEMLQAAVDCGLHGVVSSSVPIEEIAEVLLRIWRGERKFRFSGGRPYYIPLMPPDGADFDAGRTFGQFA